MVIIDIIHAYLTVHGIDVSIVSHDGALATVDRQLSLSIRGIFSFSSADNVCLHVSCDTAFFYLFSAIEDDDYLLYKTCKCAQVHSTIAGADYCFDCENRAHVHFDGYDFCAFTYSTRL